MKPVTIIRLGLWVAFALAYPGESIFEWQFGVMWLCCIFIAVVDYCEGLNKGADAGIKAGVDHARAVLRDTLLAARGKE